MERKLDLSIGKIFEKHKENILNCYTVYCMNYFIFMFSFVYLTCPNLFFHLQPPAARPRHSHYTMDHTYTVTIISLIHTYLLLSHTSLGSLTHTSLLFSLSYFSLSTLLLAFSSLSLSHFIFQGRRGYFQWKKSLLSSPIWKFSLISCRSHDLSDYTLIHNRTHTHARTHAHTHAIYLSTLYLWVCFYFSPSPLLPHFPRIFQFFFTLINFHTSHPFLLL